MFNLKRIIILILCLSLFFGTVGALASCNQTPTKDNGAKTTAPFTAGTPSESTAVSTFNETAAETTGPDSAVTETTGPETTAPVTTAPETTVPVTTAPVTTAPETTVPVTTAPVTTEPETTGPENDPQSHSPLFIPYVSQDDAILYYNEVVLDAEFVNGGNATLVQKWAYPITYYVYGQPTDEDMQVLNRFTDYLNTIEGFPGIHQAERSNTEKLSIFFCSHQEMVNRLGNNYAGCDGGVVFWYNGINEIYDATICICTEIDQYVRNSVILEEIYNGLGPVQDTDLRPDSLIFSGYSTPQWLHPIDELILKLLYHPSVKCGMTAAQCKSIIQSLYY